MSLMHYLFQTMPLDGAQRAVLPILSAADPYDVPAMALHRHLAFIPPHRLDNRRIGSKLPAKQLPTLQKIWNFRLDPDPSCFREVDVAVRNDDFKRYRVLDRVAFGLEREPGQFSPVVQIEYRGTPVELPLTRAFLCQTWTTTDGIQVAGESSLWPLHAHHDVTAMNVFVFQLVGKKAVPLQAAHMGRGPQALEHLLTALLATADDGGSFTSMPEPARPQTDDRDDDEDPIDLSDLLASTMSRLAHMTVRDVIAFDDILPSPFSDAVGTIGSTPIDVHLRPPVVVVACSLTCCKERADFEPGSAVGVGRLYPHMLVISSTDLGRIDGSVQLDRPSETTISGATQPCHQEMHSGIRSALFTDSNPENRSTWPWLPAPERAPLPQWANLFSYYLRDPFTSHSGPTRFRCVRSDRPHERVAHGLVHRTMPRYLELWNLTNGTTHKVPRQGAFDNVHIAPTMRIDATHLIVRRSTGSPEVSHISGNPAALRIDSIGMAPMCPHDCLHIHWRWGDGSTEPSVFGWGPAGPYTVPGAPMVPLNQEVDVWMRAAHGLTYSTRTTLQPRLEWLPMMHHGAGYGLSEQLSGILIDAALMPFEQTEFARQSSNGQFDVLPNSWARRYWNLQHYVDFLVDEPTVYSQVFILDPDAAYDL